jgi:ParB family transcriptional regulator, chromosome partitioning protein
MTPSRPKLVPKPSPDIACKKLILPRVNERKIEAGISSEDLAEDSARRRLLLFLNARLVRDGQGQETGFVEVPAGGRRDRALRLARQTLAVTSKTAA